MLVRRCPDDDVATAVGELNSAGVPAGTSLGPVDNFLSSGASSWANHDHKLTI